MRGAMGSKRDYNQEFDDNVVRKYAYGFDLDVMHPYMVKSFEPFFRRYGNLLELGPWKGDVTERLAKFFDDISCVEASDVAAADVTKKMGGKVTMHLGMFEDVKLPKKYDNIVMTHVLEHIDDPVRVLRRINDEW